MPKSIPYNTSIPPSLEQAVRVITPADKKPGAFQELYKLNEEIGQGAFARVYSITHLPTKTEYAVKKIDRHKMIWGDRDALQDEINSLMLVREGPNIVQLYEVYEEEDDCYLVMELMRGGELFERILERRELTEREARQAVAGILHGLSYMHERSVAHRDLKPENLLLTNHKDTVVKLADFGFAKRVKTHNGLRTLCGTPGYLAPEILERWPAYNVKCDLWSVGVILFLLLGGYLPFEDEDEDKVFERTRNGEYEFHPTYWKSVSTAAKKLVTKLLTVNPNRRYSAVDALDHEWMQMSGDAGESPPRKKSPKASAPPGEKKDTAVKIKEKAGDKQGDVAKLNENFTNYLERTKENEAEKNRLVSDKGADKAARRPNRRFEEDSKTGRPFDDFYELGDVLGEGGYACVYRASHRRTGEVFAVKDVNTGLLEKSNKSALLDEIAAMKILRGGPHIIRLFDVFEEPDHTFMVMEEMRGGDLLTRISDKEVYTEKEARKTCKILFEAMDYIHTMKIAHRDIKPENVLMVEQEDDTSIKIADFGFAKRVPKPNCLRTLCGTAQYVAPEVLDLQSSGYDQRSDMWSIGVVVYILLGGYAPFEGPVQELARAICRADYVFHDKYWSDISDQAKQMISDLLQVDPDVRLSAAQALECEWMTMEDASLMVKDLSAAKEGMQQKKHLKASGTTRVRKGVGKLESLDTSFTAGLGTFEEVAKRRKKRTDPKVEADEGKKSGQIEDSTSGKTFEDLYTWGRIIDDGEFIVHEVRHKQSKKVFAAKKLERNDLDELDAEALQSEIKCLRAVSDSPFIIKLHDVFDEPDYTYLVLERLRGGELIDKIGERECYSEDDARLVCRKVLMGLEFCHSRRIAIRNIKAESLHIADEGSYVDVKIADFSFAKKVLVPNGLSTQCGTEGYVAPEVLDHRPAYDVQCDMWSVGVVLYMLLGGYRPFRGEDEDEVIRKIRYGEYKFHKRYWKEVSEDAKILISRMLTVNPIARITATGALQSDWFMMDDDDDDEEEDDDEEGELYSEEEQ